VGECTASRFLFFFDSNMWHAPEGNTTFTGPYALMLARGISSMLEDLGNALEYNDDFECTHRAFGCLTTEQKIWTLHRVAHGLLDSQTPACHHTACLEAAIACIFRRLEDEVEMEIDNANEPAMAGDQFYWRKTLFLPYEQTGANSPEVLEDDEPLILESDDVDAWHWTIEVLEGHVLWDADYDMQHFGDMEPDKASVLRTMFAIGDEYYSTIPEDPKRPVAKKLLTEIEKLCDRVVRREEKELQRSSAA